MDKSYHSIRAENSAINKDLASIRLLLDEASQKSNMNALAYKILMGHVALQLAFTQGHCRNIESALSLDPDMEDLADDLPFQ